MPLDLSESTLTEELVELTAYCPAYEDSVKFTISLDRYNAVAEEAMLINASTLPASAVRDVLKTFVVSWDLKWNGESITIDDKGLAKVHFLFIQVPMVEALMEKLQEGKKSKTGSPSPSPTVRPQRVK